MRFAGAKAAFRRDPNDQTAARYQAVTAMSAASERR